MGFFSGGWIFVTILGAIIAAAAVVIYTVKKPVEWYTWALLIGGLVLAIIGLLIGVIQYEEEVALIKKEHLDRCGNNLFEPPKPAGKRVVLVERSY